MIKSFSEMEKKLRFVGYQGTGRISIAKFRWICVEAEAIGVETEAVCKYTASTSLVWESLLLTAINTCISPCFSDFSMKPLIKFASGCGSIAGMLVACFNKQHNPKRIKIIFALPLFLFRNTLLFLDQHLVCKTQSRLHSDVSQKEINTTILLVNWHSG